MLMNRISSRQCSLFSVLAALVGVSTALAGGFQLSVEVPPSPADPEFKNAVLLVRTFGCHQPTDATVSATAQGLVKGRRQTIKLQLKPTSKGVYALQQQWPSAGIWLIAINGSYLTGQGSALVELGQNGQVMIDSNRKTNSRISRHKLSRNEIEDSLQALATKLGGNQRAAR
jgi:hypothetical protein